MPLTLHLTDDELHSLTHRRRPDGTLLVGRQAAERALSAPAPVEPSLQAAANGLRWSRVA